MGKRLGIKAAAEATGLSIWELRTGAKAGKYPSMRVGLGAGKILFDIDMLNEHIKKIMEESIRQEKPHEHGKLRQV